MYLQLLYYNGMANVERVKLRKDRRNRPNPTFQYFIQLIFKTNKKICVILCGDVVESAVILSKQKCKVWATSLQDFPTTWLFKARPGNECAEASIFIMLHGLVWQLRSDANKLVMEERSGSKLVWLEHLQRCGAKSPSLWWGQRAAIKACNLTSASQVTIQSRVLVKSGCLIYFVYCT